IYQFGIEYNFECDKIKKNDNIILEWDFENGFVLLFINENKIIEIKNINLIYKTGENDLFPTVVYTIEDSIETKLSKLNINNNKELIKKNEKEIEDLFFNLKYLKLKDFK